MPTDTDLSPLAGLPDPATLPSFAQLGENDRAFIQRVFASDPAKYLAKLKSVGMTGHRRVLDRAGG